MTAQDNGKEKISPSRPKSRSTERNSIFALRIILVYFIFPGLFFGSAGFGLCQDSYPIKASPSDIRSARDSGVKYFKNYSRQDYKNLSQNWCVLQDKRGIVYVGNHGGLMEYDGESWREITIPNSTVRSMAMTDNGTIFLGGNNEFGLLFPDSKGKLQYRSLVDHLPSGCRYFSNVWETYWMEEGVYFRTSKFLFRWNPRLKKIKMWEAGQVFDLSFTCGGKLFIQQNEIGLQEMVNDTLSLVPDGRKLRGKKIYMLVAYDRQQMLVGTRDSGFFLYDGLNAVPFASAAAEDLREKKISHGIRLSSGDFAVATLRGGLVIMDRQGHLKHIFDKDSGLQDNNVKYVFEDNQGCLWLALNRGIAKIEYASPLSIYNDQSDLPGIVLSVCRHGARNDLYAGTTEGLFKQHSSGKFTPVGLTSNCWCLLSVGDALLAATSEGVFQLGGNYKGKLTEEATYILSRSKEHSNRIWVGTRLGLASLYSRGGNGHWREEYNFESITEPISSIVEDRQGDLWLGTSAAGVLKISFPGDGTMAQPAVVRHNISRGLSSKAVDVFWAADHVIFTTARGILRYNSHQNIFLPDHTLGEAFADGSRKIFQLVEDQSQNIWFHSDSENFQAILQPGGSFKIDAGALHRIPLTQVNSIYPDGRVVWLASDDGLIRYDSGGKINSGFDFPTLLRRVTIDGKLVFEGYKKNRDSEPDSLNPADGFYGRNIRFEFAAPFFEAESETQYRCRMEGYDEAWSSWGMENIRDYTNLDSGEYKFYVESKNVYCHLGSQAEFQFEILPPWYQSWWAYLIYALAAFLIVYMIVRWRSRNLKLEKYKLEAIVKDRTREIKDKSHLLEEQAEKLKEMDQAKSRFFANISHEFRTPLTLIMGPLEQMLSDTGESEQRRRLRLMLRNSQRLLGLINQLLELSKIDSGKLNLQASRQDIVPFLKGIVATFELLAVQNDQELIFQTGEDKIFLYFDPEKIEEILCNLLSNAIKFTPQGGRITVTVSMSSTRQEDFPAGSVDISVIDTGPGIPREKLTHIFDRFYQLERISEHHPQGTGIGLAIVKELVELHHGRIEASSGEDRGTEFKIRLPVGTDYLKPEEISQKVDGRASQQKTCQIKDTHLDDDEDFEMERTGEDEVEKMEEDREFGTTAKEIILVVEDSADVREFIRGSLEPQYRVLEAKDGQEGVDKALEMIPDLIISDIMMPRLDGFELCRLLKNDVKTSHIPIILLTARASEESVIEGLEIGADDYVVKPFDTRILCARIKNLIDLRRHLQESLKREMTLKPVMISLSQIDKEFVQELNGMIEKNLSDSEFNVEELSKKLYMSRASLYRKILALSGESPSEFIRSYRLKRAAELLKNTKPGSLKVADVAFDVGFSSTAYFTKCFKEKFHQLPSTFQASRSASS